MKAVKDFFSQNDTQKDIVPVGQILINIVILNEVISFTTKCRNVSSLVKKIRNSYSRICKEKYKQYIPDLQTGISVNAPSRIVTYVFNRHVTLAEVRDLLHAISKHIEQEVFLQLMETWASINHRLDLNEAAGRLRLQESIDPNDPISSYDGVRTTGIEIVDDTNTIISRYRLYYPERTSHSVAVGLKLWLNLVNLRAEGYVVEGLNEFTIHQDYLEAITRYCGTLDIRLGEVSEENPLIVAPKSSTFYGKQLNHYKFTKIVEVITDDLKELSDAYHAELKG